jgi:hypothetical protein
MIRDTGPSAAAGSRAPAPRPPGTSGRTASCPETPPATEASRDGPAQAEDGAMAGRASPANRASPAPSARARGPGLLLPGPGSRPGPTCLLMRLITGNLRFSYKGGRRPCR